MAMKQPSAKSGPFAAASHQKDLMELIRIPPMESPSELSTRVKSPSIRSAPSTRGSQKKKSSKKVIQEREEESTSESEATSSSSNEDEESSELSESEWKQKAEECMNETLKGIVQRAQEKRRKEARMKKALVDVPMASSFADPKKSESSSIVKNPIIKMRRQEFQSMAPVYGVSMPMKPCVIEIEKPAEVKTLHASSVNELDKLENLKKEEGETKAYLSKSPGNNLKLELDVISDFSFKF